MKTAIITITDAAGWTDKYTVGVIDITHIYLARWKYNDTPINKDAVRRGSVYHVAELKGWTKPEKGFDLYDRVWDWLRGLGKLDGMNFIRQ